MKRLKIVVATLILTMFVTTSGAHCLPMQDSKRICGIAEMDRAFLSRGVKDFNLLQENILLKNMQNEVSKIAKQYKISKKVGRAYVTALANKAAKYYGYTVTKTTTKSGDKVYTLKSADKTYKLTKGKTAYTVTENGYGYCREYLGI